MRQVKVLLLGCGFLASNFLPFILPHASHVILLDRERIEPINYDNHVIPKGYEGRRKVTALASLIQVLSNVPVTPIHMNVKTAGQLIELHNQLRPDIAICTFDNIMARIIAQQYALETKTPTLFIGVTEDYIYVDWDEYVVLPSPNDERVGEELRRVRDVCSRIEFRGLGALAAGLAYFSFRKWLEDESKIAFIASTKDGVSIKELKRC
jgi:hypothetical protein